MAKIAPFRGIRYNSHKVGDLSKVVSQPYDRVRYGLQDQYYDLHSYNIVRITKGKPSPNDNGENVYTRAASYLEGWLKEGVLLRDETPALYVYHQQYRFDGEQLTRKGVIALGKLEPETL